MTKNQYKALTLTVETVAAIQWAKHTWGYRTMSDLIQSLIREHKEKVEKDAQLVEI